MAQAGISHAWLSTTAAIVCWYCSNIGVLLLNKYLLSSTGFHNPAFLTLAHMLACAAIGSILAGLKWTPSKLIRSRQQFLTVVLLSAVFCMTVVLGNVSLAFIPVSFTQTIGSTTPFFTAILAFVMQGQREAPFTYAALIPIMLGVIVASGGEPAFHVIGFTCCVAATALRALKSVVQSILMTDPAEKLDPMSLLLYMSCTSILFLLPLTLTLEPNSFREAAALAASSPSFLYWLVANSCLAYLVNLTNFLVTRYTSALTLQVLGNAKGVVAAAVSVAIFRNVVTAQGCIGYGVTVAGVFLYSECKSYNAAATATAGRAFEDDEAKDLTDREPLLTSKFVHTGDMQVHNCSKHPPTSRA